MPEMLQRNAEEENMMETVDTERLTCDGCGHEFVVGDMVHEIADECLCWICYNVRWGKGMEGMT